MNIDELILSIQVEQEQAQKKRARAVAEVKTILAKARQEGRANLTEEEDTDCTQAFARRDQADKELQGIAVKLANAQRAKAAEDEIESNLEIRTGNPQNTATSKPAYDRVARVGQEERTYHQGNTRGGGRFVRDVVRTYLHRDLESEARLNRHMAEERVERGQYLERADATTANFTGLVVPQYLTEMYAPKTAAMRPFADACNKHALPESGMTVNISKITTGSSVAVQVNESDLVSETAMDDTLLTESVLTAAGSQGLSRQAVDRGTGIEDIVMNDLQRRYATNLDGQLITRATVGLSAVSVATTYDDTSPTGAELYPKLLSAASGVEAALLGFAAPDVVLMHSRRWYWLNAQMTSTWPLLNQPALAPQVAGQNINERYGSGARGVLPNGMVAIVDNNIAVNLGAGTNQDEVYVVPSDECHLWEDPSAPQFIRAEQPRAKNLAVDLVLYGYFAFSFRRFDNAMQKISGTGLVTPAF